MLNYALFATPTREKALREAGISFEVMTVQARKSYIFADTDLNKVLQATSSVIEDQYRSEFDGIQVVVLKRVDPSKVATVQTGDIPLCVESWGYVDSSVIKGHFTTVIKECSILFPVKRINLCVNEYRETSMTPKASRGELNIFVWASSKGKSTNDYVSASHLFEHSFGPKGSYRIWLPSGDGIVIVDRRGTAIAELIGENLYIFYPLMNRDAQNRDSILRKILTEASFLFNLSVEDVKKRILEREREHDEFLKKEAEEHPVVIKYSNAPASCKKKIIAAAKDFVASFGGKPIHIYDYSDSAREHEIVNDGRTYICIYSTPKSIRGGGYMKDILFGKKFTSRGSYEILSPSKTSGAILLVDEDDNQYGEMVGNTIYIHYPIMGEYLEVVWDGKGPEALLRRMLEEVVFIKTATDEEKQKRAREVFQRNQAKYRDAYINACKGRIGAALMAAENILRGHPSTIENYQKTIVKLVREVNEAQSQIEILKQGQEKALENYAKEFDALCAIPQIKKLEVPPGIIQVFTNTLYCVDPRSKKCHDIGEFRIDLHFDGVIRFNNLTRKVDGYKNQMNAPHVYQSGEPCLGNLSEVIPQLFAHYEFSTLAMIAIQFIENVNVNDYAGAYIDKWPLAPERS